MARVRERVAAVTDRELVQATAERELELRRQELEARDERIATGELAKLEGKRLKPGMPAEAFIQTAARSPLSYLLRPLLDQINHAMRED